MRPSINLVSFLILLAACGGRDPILDRAEALDSKAEEGTPGPAGSSSAAPPRGTPAEPSPVQPPEPRPATAGAPDAREAPAPMPGRATPPPPPPKEEAGTSLSGEVVLADHKGGAIRVDVFDGDQKAASGGGKRPGVVAMARLDAPGPFQVTVPGGTNRVWIGAFADEDQDGKPGPLDPEVWYAANPIVLNGNTADIQLVLERREPPPHK